MNKGTYKFAGLLLGVAGLFMIGAKPHLATLVGYIFTGILTEAEMDSIFAPLDMAFTVLPIATGLSTLLCGLRLRSAARIEEGYWSIGIIVLGIIQVSLSGYNLYAFIWEWVWASEYTRA